MTRVVASCGITALRTWRICATAAVAVVALSGLGMAQQDKAQDKARDNQVDLQVRRVDASKDFAMAQSWQKSSDLAGKKVTNSANEDLGKIEDIVIDAATGRILYGVLSFGGVLGMGDKLFAIPWHSLSMSGDSKAFVLNVEKDRLKTASSFDKAHWPNFADEQFSTATFKYYNQPPYWDLKEGNVRPAPATDDRSMNSHRERWYQHATIWQKASDLSGKDVRNTQNDELGEISDLAIDPLGGRVLYGILSSGGKLYAIPWAALSLNADYKQFVLNINKDQLKDNVSFGKDSWPNMADERWAREAHAHYKVQPYWTDARVEVTPTKP